MLPRVKLSSRLVEIPEQKLMGALHIRRTIETDPDVPKWNLIMDCLNTHQSESLVRLVAEKEGRTYALTNQPKYEASAKITEFLWQVKFGPSQTIAKSP